MTTALSHTLPFSCFDIAVCTFRRPELARTLRSLAGIKIPADSSVRIIVADNDTVPSAMGLVEGLRAELPFPIDYVHCPASNISIARNACLEHSRGELLAFIDDDETASTDWLIRLVEKMDESGADVVLGPVEAQYAAVAPKWMRRGDFHSTLPVWVGGEIRTGYTCNVLLRLTAAALAGRRFSLSLGRTGGEDTEFFTLARKAGSRIDFAPDAWVHEPVTDNRATLGWLAKRRYRMGQTHGRLLAQNADKSRAAQVGVAGAKALFCVGASVATALSPARRYGYGLRAVLHLGAISGLMGVREIEQYGLPETRTL